MRVDLAAVGWQDDEPRVECVEGIPTTTPGLVVTPAIGTAALEHPGDGDGWRVTHFSSGLAMGPVYDTVAIAQAVARELRGLADWTASHEVLAARRDSDPRFHRAVGRVLKRAAR